MAEDGYVSSNTSHWDDQPTEHRVTSSNSYGHGRPSYSLDSVDESSPSGAETASVSPPPPRSSTDSAGRSSSSQQPWRENTATTATLIERRDTLSTIHTAYTPSLVEPTFDENVLRALCELDCGVPLLLDRIKQGIVSCREASVFFKKRALIEEEYGKMLHKLSRTTSEAYALNDGKAGSFVSAWQSSMRIHESMAENRLRFAQRLNEMSDELATLVKEVDKNRKQTKDLATRYERALQESEGITEKCKNRLDFASEELERVLIQKEGESVKDTGLQNRTGGTGGKRAIGKAVAKGGMLLKGKNPGNIQRQEDDIRARVSTASDQYRKSLIETQAMRQEYFNFQLPRILRALKECADEIDLGTQYHLTRYAFLFESIVLSDGTTLAPPSDEGVGLKATIETIDNRGDFKTYMQNYAFARGSAPPRGPRREGPSEEGFVSKASFIPSKGHLLRLQHNLEPRLTEIFSILLTTQLPPLPTFNDKTHAAVSPPATNGSNGIQDKGRPTFGVDLAEQMTRDNVEVPPIMAKCCEAIEKYGIRSQGIYRVSGVASKVAMLKQKLDKDLEAVDLDAPEWSGDINNVASVLKMWLRELPDPLLTNSLHQGFIEAAKIENDRLRHIRLHERVNELPDPNYATLKYFLGHLHRINQHSAENSMSMQNLAIVFGPTLFGQGASINGQGGVMADQSYQNTAIETILKHYTDIFIDESE